MKKGLIIGSVLTLMVMISGSITSAEEAGWFHHAEGWIVRIYTSGTGPYAVNLEVLDTNNQLIDPANIVGLATNPHLVIGNASTPDISFAFNENTSTAYVIYRDGGGGIVLQEVPGITSGAPPALPQLSVSTNAVNFGSITVGSSLNSTVTVSNTGSGNLSFTSINTSGAPFSITGGTCAVGTPVAPGGNCTVIVRFAPTAVTAYNGSLSISSNGGPAVVTLTGTGSIK